MKSLSAYRLAVALLTGGTCAAIGAEPPGPIASAGYPLLLERANAPRNNFFVYLDADSGLNHGVPSGVFGAFTKVRLNGACIDDPTASSTNGCSSVPQAFNRARGTAFQISFDPLTGTEFAGVNFEEPARFAARPGTVGYDLRGATRLIFDVRCPTPGGMRVQFGLGGQTNEFVQLPQSSNYTSMSIPLAGIDLSDTRILFTVVTNAVNAPNGGTVLVDNIRLDPTPASSASAVGLPVTYQTFGISPALRPLSNRVPVPPDQQLKNLGAVYDASLLLLALLQRGTEPDLSAAKAVADSLVYLRQHDNQGGLLPAAPDGSRGFHNGYAAGESVLRNDQEAPALGKRGDAKLAGFSGGTTMCGAGGFCLVLNGGLTGPNASAGLALVAAYRSLKDQRYLSEARDVGKWLLGMAAPTGGYGGYYNGYDETPDRLRLNLGKSTESNSLIYAYFVALADAEQELGNSDAANRWTQAAFAAGDFVIRMFNPAAGRFYAGTVPAELPPGPGIVPGAIRDNDAINTFDFLDANTLPIIGLAASNRYQNQIDWRLPLRWILQSYPRTIQVGSQSFQGLGLIAQTSTGPNGIAWEFTAQAVLAMRIVDRIYAENEFETPANQYLSQVRQAQIAAPFGDGRGITAATLQDGDTLAPTEHCLSTPFQCIPSRVALAATVFSIFAEMRVSPLGVAPRIAPAGILNAASFRPAPNNNVSPGTIVSIFGVGLAEAVSSASLTSDRLPTVLKGTSVLVNGVCAPLIYVSQSQINAQIPDVTASSNTVQVTVGIAVSGNDCTRATATASQAVPFSLASPGLLTLSGGQGTVLAQHSDYTLVQAGSPARTGEIIVLYGTGFGPTTPAIPAGQIVSSTHQASSVIAVTIGSVRLSAADILFAGLTPGFAGLWQFNIRVPAGLSGGDQPVLISSGAATSQQGVTLPVAP